MIVSKHSVVICIDAIEAGTLHAFAVTARNSVRTLFPVYSAVFNVLIFRLVKVIRVLQLYQLKRWLLVGLTVAATFYNLKNIVL